MGCATKIMPDNTKLRVSGTWWHSILPVGPCLGHTGPVGLRPTAALVDEIQHMVPIRRLAEFTG